MTKPISDFYFDDSGVFLKDIPVGDYLYDAEPMGELLFDIASYGASPAHLDNAEFINAAVEDASKSGGTVVVKSGAFKTSTVKLLDNVTLWVAKGASLVSLTKEQNDISHKLKGAVIYADGAKNITVTGGGRICGSGASFYRRPRNEGKYLPLSTFYIKKHVVEFTKTLRQRNKNVTPINIINFEKCLNVTIAGIELYESESWTCNLLDCENVTIKDVVINNDVKIPESDGIDLVGCKNVSVSHCFITSGDDGIVIKTKGDCDAENIEVSDCIILSMANSFKIGSETLRDVKDVTVRDCTFIKGDVAGGYAGIAIESCDGANISNISVKNIVMKGVLAPLLVWLGKRFRYAKKSVGSVDSLTVENITATDVDAPSAVVGTKLGDTVYSPTNVKLKNFSVTYRNNKEKLRLGTVPKDRVMSNYPEIINVISHYVGLHEFSSYKDLPAYGLYTHLADVSCENFNVTPRSGNNRPPFNKKHE